MLFFNVFIDFIKVFSPCAWYPKANPLKLILVLYFAMKAMCNATSLALEEKPLLQEPWTKSASQSHKVAKMKTLIYIAAIMIILDNKYAFENELGITNLRGHPHGPLKENKYC